MSRSLNKGAALGAVSIMPLLDVVFLLLIFYMVTTRFADVDRELDVVLPSASEAQPLIATPKEVFVNVNEQGQYYVNGKIIGIDDVEDVLQDAVANNPVNQTVIIRADKRVRLDPVVAVMNICNRVGVANYSLTTEGGG